MPLNLASTPAECSDCCSSYLRLLVVESVPVPHIGDVSVPTVTFRIVHPVAEYMLPYVPSNTLLNHSNALPSPLYNSAKCPPIVFRSYKILAPTAQYLSTKISVSTVGRSAFECIELPRCRQWTTLRRSDTPGTYWNHESVPRRLPIHP